MIARKSAASHLRKNGAPFERAHLDLTVELVISEEDPSSLKFISSAKPLVWNDFILMQIKLLTAKFLHLASF